MAIFVYTNMQPDITGLGNHQNDSRRGRILFTDALKICGEKYAFIYLQLSEMS